ncbi:tetratricopeptide repeat protein [Prevotella sp.]
MDVKDVFELRRQGRTEDAYAAILPLYAAHKGHYTTIAMFWVGVDMMRLRYQQRRLEEAYKIFKSLMRLYPTMKDTDLKGQSAMMRAAIQVFEHHNSFSILDFITHWNITRLTDDDWKGTQHEGFVTPSTGMRIVGKVFKEVAANPTVDMALRAAPILAEALKHSPYNRDNQRYKAIIYQIMGKKDKAINVYRHLISRSKKSNEFQELANLIEDERYKIALLCKAITLQRDEKFRQRLRFTLAELLFRQDKARARYELDKCLEARRQAGYTITWAMQNLAASLSEVNPVSDAAEKAFYREQEIVVKELIL